MIVRGSDEQPSFRFEEAVELAKDLRRDALVQVFQDFHASNHLERFIGKRELLQVSPHIDAASSSSAEGEAGVIGIAANSQLTERSHLKDKVPRSASGIKDLLSVADPNKVEELEFIVMPSLANWITRS